MTHWAEDISNMATLESLELSDIHPNQNLYQLYLSSIESQSYGKDKVTSAFVKHLTGLLYKKRNQHDLTPTNMLSSFQICHILGFLVCKMQPENVTKPFQDTLLKHISRSKAGKDLGKAVTQFIQKKCGYAEQND